jgi:uncharacterized membrane protein
MNLIIFICPIAGFAVGVWIGFLAGKVRYWKYKYLYLHAKYQQLKDKKGE